MQQYLGVVTCAGYGQYEHKISDLISRFKEAGGVVMKLSYKLVIAAFFFTVIGSFIWSANHYYSKYQHEKKRADEAVQNAKSATVITNNVLQSL